MRPLALAGGLLLVALAVVAGCSDDTGTLPPPSSDEPDTGVPVVDASVADVTPLPPPGPFEIVEEPDPGCVATSSASPVELAVPSELALTSLQVAGGRLLAEDLSGRGFVLFDAAGTNPSAAPIAVGWEARAAAFEGGIVAVGLDDASTLLVQRYEPNGTPLGDRHALGEVQLGRRLGVGAAGDKSLVAWAPPDDSLRARILRASGALANEILLESDAPFGDLSTAIAPSRANDGSDFLVTWALHRVALGEYRVYAALVNESGIVGLPRALFGTDRAVRLVGAVAHDGGATLLANLDGEPMVVPLDVLGRPSGPARLLRGARDVIMGGGHDLAQSGENVAIVARHGSGALALRSFDLAGRPSDGWICLHAPEPDELLVAGVAPADAGYAVVLTGPQGRTSLLRVSATGREPLP